MKCYWAGLLDVRCWPGKWKLDVWINLDDDGPRVTQPWVRINEYPRFIRIFPDFHVSIFPSVPHTEHSPSLSWAVRNLPSTGRWLLCVLWWLFVNLWRFEDLKTVDGIICWFNPRVGVGPRALDRVQCLLHIRSRVSYPQLSTSPGSYCSDS